MIFFTVLGDLYENIKKCKMKKNFLISQPINWLKIKSTPRKKTLKSVY